MQKSAVEFYINCFPTIAYADEISSQMENGNGFRFYDGFAAETSGKLQIKLSMIWNGYCIGGLLVAMKAKDAEGYQREFVLTYFY